MRGSQFHHLRVDFGFRIFSHRFLRGLLGRKRLFLWSLKAQSAINCCSELSNFVTSIGLSHIFDGDVGLFPDLAASIGNHFFRFKNTFSYFKIVTVFWARSKVSNIWYSKDKKRRLFWPPSRFGHKTGPNLIVTIKTNFL
jgi:hypothetical protein